MRVLVLGASGATGSLVVRQLIRREIQTRILIRKSAVLPEEVLESPLVETVKGSINDLGQSEMDKLLENCDAVISCLGHNISLKGMFGKPRYLVRDAMRSVCETAERSAGKNIKIVLMSTTAYTNTSSKEKSSIGERIIFSLLTLLLPPHRDNVRAADFLIRDIGRSNKRIEWVAVRPDTLTHSDVESSYEVFEYRVRSPIFNAGKTSRINVSHFMAELVTDDRLWNKWLFKTPTVYDK